MSSDPSTTESDQSEPDSADTESNITTCEWCGDTFASRGIGAHKRYCDAKPEESEQTKSESEENTSISVSDPSKRPLQADVVERDGCQCKRCGVSGTPPDVVDDSA